MSLAVDPEHPGRLIMSAWGRVMPGHFSSDIGGGIFVSDDDGKSWNAALSQDQHIHDITYDLALKHFMPAVLRDQPTDQSTLKPGNVFQATILNGVDVWEFDPQDPRKNIYTNLWWWSMVWPRRWR
jgi:hypothetical protein